MSPTSFATSVLPMVTGMLAGISCAEVAFTPERTEKHTGPGALAKDLAALVANVASAPDESAMRAAVATLPDAIAAAKAAHNATGNIPRWTLIKAALQAGAEAAWLASKA